MDPVTTTTIPMMTDPMVNGGLPMLSNAAANAFI